MKNIITKFKLFLESDSYRDKLEEILDNPENNYVVIKNDEIIAGFEILEDAFTHLGEILEGENILSEEDKYEFDDEVSLMTPSLGEEPEQIEIDDVVNTILDRFDILEPYKIKVRTDLEDNSIDSDNSEEEEEGSEEVSNLTDQDELNTFLSERANMDMNLDVVLFGIKDGTRKKLDMFASKEEAESFLPEYKDTFDEYDDFVIINKNKE